MSMLLKIPFYKNEGDGNQCLQVAIQSVLKYFCNRDYSLEELDTLTRRKKGFWTWTSQGVIVLREEGLGVKYYSRTDLKPFLKGEPFIRKHFGKDAEKMLAFTDLPITLESINKLLKLNIFERRTLSFAEVESHLTQGHVPIMLIDHNKIVGKDGLYQGHFVVVTGFDADYVFYHDSGPQHPEANKKVRKSTFIEAWNANGTDNDVVLVYGKKK